MKIIPGTTRGKLVLSVVVAMVIVGTAFLGDITETSGEGGIMVKLFLLFLGAIIAMQVVPGMLLFGAMVKALGNLTRKETVKEPQK